MTIYQRQLWWRPVRPVQSKTIVFFQVVNEGCDLHHTLNECPACMVQRPKAREAVQHNTNTLNAKMSLQLATSLQPAHMLPFSDKSRHTFYSEQAI